MDGEGRRLLLRARGAKPSRCPRALAAESGRLPVLLGNSGVGKSSLAQAGVLAALGGRPGRSGAAAGRVAARLPGQPRLVLSRARAGRRAAEGAGRDLSSTPGNSTRPTRARRRQERMDRSAVDGKAALARPAGRDRAPLRGAGTAQAAGLLPLCRSGRGALRARGGAPAPPFLRDSGAGARRPAPARADEHALGLLRRIAERRAAVQRAPQGRRAAVARSASLREVVSEPAALLSARFESDGLAGVITRAHAWRIPPRTWARCRCCPTRSTTCGRRWSQRGDGVLRLPPQSFELGGVLAERADAFLVRIRRRRRRCGACSPQARHRARGWRADPAAGAALGVHGRGMAAGSELADHPNRLLVTATPEGGETYAEVAHEAIFRRWEKLQEWIAGRARVPRLEERPGSRAPRLAGAPDVAKTTRCSWAWRWRRRRSGSQARRGFVAIR